MTKQYLTRIQIDGSVAENPYCWHKAIWRLFPERPDSPRDFLFRVEKNQKGQPAIMFLQSATPPMMTSTEIRCLTEPKCIDYGQLKKGQQLRFILQANVTKKVNKSRVPVIDDELRLAWLQRKLVGATILQSTVNEAQTLYFVKVKEGDKEIENGKKIMAGKIVTVNFEGVLQIDDPKLFIDILTHGAGAAKAFGCGLLSVARY